MHAQVQESMPMHKGLRSSHHLSSNQLNKSSSSTANSIVQEYKTYSKNFFSKQSQNNHVHSGLHQPQIISGIQQSSSVMATFNNKENIEMRAQSSGNPNSSNRGVYAGS